MKKLVALMFVVACSAASADHIPATLGGVVEFHGRVAVIGDIGDFDPMIELEVRVEDEDHELRYRSLTAGTYYRVLDNLKVGAFYRLQAGARHIDDWVDTSPGWEWLDARSRWENLLILDVSPRFLLEFLPGENWVFMVKNRYLWNTANGDQSLQIRPGLTWFWMRNREPVLNVGIAYEAYLALNFGEKLIYERWPYLNLLYHASPNLKLELTGAYRTTTWTESEDVVAAAESGWEVDSKALVVGIGVLLMVSR